MGGVIVVAGAGAAATGAAGLGFGGTFGGGAAEVAELGAVATLASCVVVPSGEPVVPVLPGADESGAWLTSRAFEASDG